MEAAAREKAGTTGDMEARDVAEQQYAQNHKFANIAGTVTSFGIDPLTWASAGAGNATVRGSMWLGGRLFGQAATRRFATTLTGRMLSGSLGAAANLGTFEAGTEIADQARWGGKMTPNPFTGRYEVGDYSAGAVFGRFGHGAMMGTATGIVAPLLGNVSNKLVQSTESTAGKLGIRAGELGVGTVAEGTIFSVPEIIETYGQYNDMIESLSDPNSQYYIADETERAAKIEEMRSKRGDAMMDVWTDNMAMMAGFKLQHGLKSAPRTIAELSQSPGRLKTGFETRLRSILDGRSDLALTVDEKAELERGGYKDLTELTDDYQRYLANPPQRGGERITDPNRQIGSDMPENVSGGLPYNRFVELMNDGNISEAARAKMYYYITGHSLPMSTVMGSRMVENRDADGNLSGYIVESVGANGVITSRSFANKKSAEVEVNRINRQAELNSVDVGEQYAEAAHEQRRVKAACEKASEQTGVASSELEKLMQTDPAKMTDAQKALVDVVRGAYDELGEEFEHRQNKWYRKQVSMTPKAIREHINEVFGVDVDKAIRKEPDRRSEKEQQAVNEYVQRLFNEAEAETRESEAGEEAAPGQWDADMNGQRLLSRNEQDNGEGPGGEAGANDGTGANEPSGDTPPVDVPPRGNNGGGSTPSAAYSRGQEAIKSGNAVGVRDIGHEVSLADARMARVFGNNQDLLRQAYEAVESGQTDAFLSANGEALNEAQTDAVRKLADAVEVMRGVDEAIEEQVAMTSQQTEEDIKPYQNEQGDIIPIQLINGVTVYHKNGDLNNQYGTVNVAYAGKDGQPKTAQVAHKDIQQVGQPMTPEAFVQHQTRQQREANERKYKSWIDGTDFTTGNSLDLTVAGHTDTFTIKGFFANGDMQLADADGNAIRMTKEEVTQFLQATETKRIEEELSGEMAAWREQARQQREAARAAAEAERQERFRNGIVGYSESKPDYSAPESDPAVVAEYLLSLAENGQKMPGEEGTDTTAEDGEGRAAAREKVLKNIQGEKDLLLQNEQQARQQWQEAQDWLDANDGISDPVEQAKAIQQRRGAELALQNISERQKKWAAVRDQIMTKAEKEAFMQERRQRISSLRPKNVDIADNIEPYQTVYEENGIDVTNDEAISKHLLDTYQEQGDAQAAINAERITLRNYQRDQVQPEIDRLRGVVDDYVQGRSEYDDATLRQAVGDLAQLEAYQSALTAKARDLKSVVDRLPNIYADRNKAAFAELPAAYQRMSRFDRA